MFKLSVPNDPNLCCQSTTIPGRDSLGGQQSDCSVRESHTTTCFNGNFMDANHAISPAAIKSSVHPVRPAQYPEPELRMRTNSSRQPSNLLYNSFPNHSSIDEGMFHSQSDILPSSHSQVWGTEWSTTSPNDPQPQHIPLAEVISATQPEYFEANKPINSSEKDIMRRPFSSIPWSSGGGPSPDVNQYVSLFVPFLK